MRLAVCLQQLLLSIWSCGAGLQHERLARYQDAEKSFPYSGFHSRSVKNRAGQFYCTEGFCLTQIHIANAHMRI